MPNARVSSLYKVCHVMFGNAVDKIISQKNQYSFLKPTKTDF